MFGFASLCHGRPLRVQGELVGQRHGSAPFLAEGLGWVLAWYLAEAHTWLLN